MTDQREPRVSRSGNAERDPWQFLRALTTARIGLGHSGVSLPTRHHLEFQLAHAQARDAVHAELDSAGLARGLASRGHDVIVARSEAADRTMYLRRPDLGRRLEADSASRVAAVSGGGPAGFDAAFVIADGLSALAVQRHALPFLDAMLPHLERGPESWRLAPIVVVEQGRVAISDEIGALLGADQVAILIGERPGLSAPDSLGIYLTWGPRLGNTDAERNCISNIRGAGLSYDDAASTLAYLMREARRRRLSGVSLKNEAGTALPLPEDELRHTGNFLVSRPRSTEHPLVQGESPSGAAPSGTSVDRCGRDDPRQPA